MEKFKVAAKNLVENDLGRKDSYHYSKKYSSVGIFDGVWWILSLVILITIGIYNGWQLLKQIITQTGWQNSTINTILFILFGVSLVVALIEKCKLFKEAKIENKNKTFFVEERNKLLEECDNAAKQSGVDIYPWWRKFNGLDYRRKGDEPIVTFMDSYPLRKDKDGEYICEFGEGEEKYSGEKLLEKMNELTEEGAPKFKIFLSKKIEAKNTYYVAPIITFDGDSAEKEYTEWVEDKDAAEKIKEYETTLDFNERARNMNSGSGYATNEDLYFRGKKSYGNYTFDNELRKKKIQSYENSLGHSERGVINEGMYYLYIDYHGFMVFDENMNELLGVLIPVDKKCWNYFILATNYEMGKNCRVKDVISTKLTFAEPEKVLCGIANFPQSEMDFTIAKPGNVTDEEWGIWIYSHYAEDTIFYKEKY